MDLLKVIPDFLKTTILGIIILGACGSLLALAVLRLLKWLLQFLKYIFKKVLPRQAKRIVLIFLKIVYSYGQRVGRYTTLRPAVGVTFYCAYHLVCTVCFLIFSATMAVITFIIVSGTKSGTLLTTTTFLLIMGTILFAFWSLRHLFFIILPYHNYLGILAQILDEENKSGTPSNAENAEGNIKHSRQPFAGDILKTPSDH
jgi:hypothetical protein